jgi:hypothetical protein
MLTCSVLLTFDCPQSADHDVSNFDDEFTSQAPTDSPADYLSSSVANLFEGFTYGKILCQVLSSLVKSCYRSVVDYPDSLPFLTP